MHVEYTRSFVVILSLLWLQTRSSLFVALAASPMRRMYSGLELLILEYYRYYYVMYYDVVLCLLLLSSSLNQALCWFRTTNLYHVITSSSKTKVLYLIFKLETCTVWVKKNPPPGDLTFFSFFHKRLIICNRFFTHLLNVPIFTRLQIFIQLSPILTKLCHIKRDYPVHVIWAKCPKRARQTFA